MRIRCDADDPRRRGAARRGRGPVPGDPYVAALPTRPYREEVGASCGGVHRSHERHKHQEGPSRLCGRRRVGGTPTRAAAHLSRSPFSGAAASFRLTVLRMDRPQGRGRETQTTPIVRKTPWGCGEGRQPWASNAWWAGCFLPRAQDRVLKSLGRRETQAGTRRNLDLLAGGRVAADARLALALTKDPQAAQS